jgi:hypothetical protein
MLNQNELKSSLKCQRCLGITFTLAFTVTLIISAVLLILTYTTIDINWVKNEQFESLPFTIFICLCLCAIQILTSFITFCCSYQSKCCVTFVIYIYTYITHSYIVLNTSTSNFVVMHYHFHNNDRRW